MIELALVFIIIVLGLALYGDALIAKIDGYILRKAGGR